MVAEWLSSYVWDGIERVRILPYTLTFFFFFPCRIFLSVDRSHLRRNMPPLCRNKKTLQYFIHNFDMPVHLRELIVCQFGYLYVAIISFYDSAGSHGTFSYEVFIRDVYFLSFERSELDGK